MIVRNEAHIIRETLDSVAPYISSWVIVDTGSNDGTQDLIRDHMARRGIAGELHERPWRNFGHNRSEALKLAQGHGDYIWVIDADDTLVGTIDFGRLGLGIYQLRQRSPYGVFWRPLLFRDGLAVRYEGVVHEYVTSDDPFTGERLEGDYHIESRRLGARNRDPQKYARDRDLLLAEVERNPEDARSVFYLAQSYSDLGITQGDLSNFEHARKWYARRVELAAGTKRPTTRCTKSRTRCRNWVRRGRRFWMPTCGPGSFDRPGWRRCMQSPRGIAAMSAIGSATCSPSAPPKSRFPNRTHSSSAQTSTPGVQPTSRRCAHPGSASMPRRSR